jgi:Tfp pilus assembly protein PilF
VELARAYASYESYNKALGVLDALAMKDPAYRNNDFYLVSGYCYFFRDDLTAAQENFQKVLDRDATNGMGLFGLACCYLKKKDESNALTFFEKAFQTKTVNEDDAKMDRRVRAFAADKRYKALMKQYF